MFGDRACGERAAGRTCACDDHRRGRRLRDACTSRSTIGSARSPPIRAQARPRGRSIAAATDSCSAAARFWSSSSRATSAAARGAQPLGHLAGVASTASPVRPARLAGRPRRAHALHARGARTGRPCARATSRSCSRRRIRRDSSTASRPRRSRSCSGRRGVPVVAVKGALGECGAAGAAGVVAAMLSLKQAGDSAHRRVRGRRSRLPRGCGSDVAADRLAAGRRSHWSTALPAVATNVSLVVTA